MAKTKQQAIEEQAEYIAKLEAALEERRAYVRDLEGYLARAALKLMDYTDLLERE